MAAASVEVQKDSDRIQLNRRRVARVLLYVRRDDRNWFENVPNLRSLALTAAVTKQLLTD
jgi:hypothetical protein